MLTERSSRQNIFSRALLIFLLVLLVACQSASPTGTAVAPSSTDSNPTPTKLPYAEVTFEAHLPAKLAEGQSLFIEILDEVTGLALNPARARMESADGQYYSIKIPIPLGSVVKYRYYRDNDPIGVEYTTDNRPVRYRLFVADAPGVVSDIIAGWRSQPASGMYGRIQGQVANKGNSAPVVNALVSAGGVQTLTSSDGSYVMEGLPPGTHNLVIYSLDGSFRPFQQGAVVAPESTTPATILMDAAQLVNVTFVVSAPQDSPGGVPIRLIGNIYQLGNTFADLDGGMSILASRAPLMQSLPDGRYSLTLRLPAGLDLRYKYTLGDGFWNAEHSTDGGMRVRQLIVPAGDVTLDDSIDTWKTPGFEPITFTVNTPQTTPASDTISIQFNPFGWTQPIPMWPVGRSRWFYVLYSPLNLFTNAAYRYCRNEQCGTADAANSRGLEAAGTPFSPKDTTQEVEDTIEAWAWSDLLTDPIVISPHEITARDGFQAAMEFLPSYRPSWQPYLPWAFQNIKDTGANTVVLTPTWHLTHQSPPVMAPVTGLDPLWFDLTQMTTQAQQAGLSVVLHPVLRYEGSTDEWWASATRDEGWWQTWFARYRTFLLYHADLANQAGATALVIGDESILPALPGGTLADGSAPNLPGDAEESWRKIIAAVRSRYTGKLVWMLPYNGKLPPVPEFVADVDRIYVQLTPPLVQSDDASPADVETAIAAILDGEILQLQEKTSQPIVLGLNLPSTAGVLDGCPGSGDCLPLNGFSVPGAEIAAQEPGWKEQAETYNAALSAVNQRSWIAGFYAVGYYPPVEIKDLSPSVRGKPAGDVLWYWYPRLTGKTAP